jgi:tetratricopeptide (TPR) repeat protein
MNPNRAIGLLGLICLLTGGCASVQELTRDLPGAKFMKYTMAGADRAQRASLDRGLTQLRAREYDTAVRSLRQAMWDVEQIDKPWLRLEELVEVHQTLAEAYTGLGKNQWREEQRALAQALVEYGRRENGSGSPETALAKAKAAYQAAHFREAVTAFGQALVELEGLSPTPVRLRSLEEARCHLVLVYFALGQAERAGEEVRRLAARDSATVSCRRQAPPPVRALIRAVEASEARLGKRSAE